MPAIFQSTSVTYSAWSRFVDYGGDAAAKRQHRVAQLASKLSEQRAKPVTSEHAARQRENSYSTLKQSAT